MENIAEKEVRWLKTKITWHGSEACRYYSATLDGEKVIFRLNDFLEEPMFTLVIAADATNGDTEFPLWDLDTGPPMEATQNAKLQKTLDKLINEEVEWDGLKCDHMFHKVVDGTELFLRVNDLMLDRTQLTIFTLDREVVDLPEVPKSWIIYHEDLGRPLVRGTPAYKKMYPRSRNETEEEFQAQEKEHSEKVIQRFKDVEQAIADGKLFERFPEARDW